MDRAETPRREFRVRRPDAQARLRLLALTVTVLAAPLLIIDNLPSTPAPDDEVALDADLVANVRELSTTTAAEEALPAQPLAAAELVAIETTTTTAAPTTTSTTVPKTTTTTAPKPTTTTAPPAPAAPAPAPAPGPAPGDVWYRLAECESGGNWSHQGTYHGGLQFHPSTWVAYGGQEFAPYAYLATPQQQITVGQRVVASHGGSFKAWPGCRAKLGLP